MRSVVLLVIILFFSCSVKKKAVEKHEVTVANHIETKVTQSEKVIDKSSSKSEVTERVSEDYSKKSTFTADSMKVNKDGSKTLYNLKGSISSNNSKESVTNTETNQQNDVKKHSNSLADLKSKSDSSDVKKSVDKEVKGQNFGSALAVVIGIVVLIVIWRKL